MERFDVLPICYTGVDVLQITLGGINVSRFVGVWGIVSGGDIEGADGVFVIRDADIFIPYKSWAEGIAEFREEAVS